MMRRTTASLAVVLLAVSVTAAEDLKSGPQVGEGGSGGFVVPFLNGRQAGKKRCPVWVQGYGLNALIFANEVSEPLTGLVKRIDKRLDESAARDPDAFGVFVVFSSDDADLKQQLQDLIAKEGLKQVVLCAGASRGPAKYHVAKEADLTVLIYSGQGGNVAANFALRKGELNEGKAAEIMKALTEVLPK